MGATFRVALIVPAISKTIAAALGACFDRADKVSITVVLDPDEEAYRLGYGDSEGLEQIQKLASNNHIGLRAQPGLRIGLLVADGDVLVWSPTPAVVQADELKTNPMGWNFLQAYTDRNRARLSTSFARQLEAMIRTCRFSRSRLVGTLSRRNRYRKQSKCFNKTLLLRSIWLERRACFPPNFSLWSLSCVVLPGRHAKSGFPVCY